MLLWAPNGKRIKLTVMKTNNEVESANAPTKWKKKHRKNIKWDDHKYETNSTIKYRKSNENDKQCEKRWAMKMENYWFLTGMYLKYNLQSPLTMTETLLYLQDVFFCFLKNLFKSFEINFNLYKSWSNIWNIPNLLAWIPQNLNFSVKMFAKKR